MSSSRDRVDGRAHALVRRRQEADERHQELRGVELVGVERLRVGLLGVAPAAGEDRLADAVAFGRPLLGLGVLAEHRRQLHGPVERGPAEHLRGEVVAGIAAHLPHALVLLLPPAGGRVGELGHEALDLRMQLAELLVVEVDGVEELTVDIELGLVPGAVADPHRRRVAPAAQVRERALREVVLAADAVHDLQRVVGARTATGGARHERDEVLRLVGARADVERLQREARVADPRVAVVPVALAADGLGERRRRRGDDGARRAVGQPLQHPRAEHGPARGARPS